MFNFIDGLVNRVREARSKFQKNLFFLFLSAQIRNVAVNVLGSFGVVFLYEKYNNSIFLLLLYYFIGSLALVISIPFIGRIICKIGIKKSIIIGSILFCITNATFLIFYKNLFLGTVINIFFLTFARTFYWVPYHIKLVSFTNKDSRGFQIGILNNLIIFLNIIIPFFSGFAIKNFGFEILFLLSCLVYIISLIPLFKLQDIKENYSLGYCQTFKNIFSKKFIREAMIFFFEGTESTFYAIIWPLLTFLILKGDYVKMGFIASIVVFGTIIINLFIGKKIDNSKDKEKIVKSGALLYSFGWIMKMFSVNGLQIALSSIYHNLSESVMRVSYDTYWYGKGEENGDYLDEYTIMREISLHSGRCVMIVIIYFLITKLNFQLKDTVLFGGLSMLLLGLLVDKNLIFFKKKNIPTLYLVDKK